MRSARGSAALELVLMTPVLLVLLLFVVFVGRLAAARGDVDRIARDAARTASFARSPAEAVTAAELSVDGSAPCVRLDVSVDTTAFAPGGTVSATVSCEVALG